MLLNNTSAAESLEHQSPRAKLQRFREIGAVDVFREDDRAHGLA